jgi:hypothetical protein
MTRWRTAWLSPWGADWARGVYERPWGRPRAAEAGWPPRCSWEPMPGLGPPHLGRGMQHVPVRVRPGHTLCAVFAALQWLRARGLARLQIEEVQLVVVARGDQ